MNNNQRTVDGRHFGWLAVVSLTIAWLLGVALRLCAFFVPDTLYHRLSRLLPGVLPLLGWTLTFTLAVLWGGLLWIHHRKRNAPVPQLTPAELLELDPQQFEKHVALIFQHKGYRARHRGKSGDHGVDLEVYPSSGRLGIVQCKRYRSTVGEGVVRDLYGAMLHEGAAHAFLVTAGNISAAAHTWAEGKPITLVDGEQLLELARELRR